MLRAPERQGPPTIARFPKLAAPPAGLSELPARRKAFPRVSQVPGSGAGVVVALPQLGCVAVERCRERIVARMARLLRVCLQRGGGRSRRRRRQLAHLCPSGGAGRIRGGCNGTLRRLPDGFRHVGRNVHIARRLHSLRADGPWTRRGGSGGWRRGRGSRRGASGIVLPWPGWRVLDRVLP